MGHTETVDVSSDTDSGRVYRGAGIDGSPDLGGVHVAGVGGVGGDAMVLLDQGIKHVSKDLHKAMLTMLEYVMKCYLVRVPVSSVDTAVLVPKINSTGNSLAQGKPYEMTRTVMSIQIKHLSHLTSLSWLWKASPRWAPSHTWRPGSAWI